MEPRRVVPGNGKLSSRVKGGIVGEGLVTAYACDRWLDA